MIPTSDVWKESLLENLAVGGAASLHAAEYIHSNRIQLNIVDTDATNLWWKIKMSATGPRLQPAMYLSRHLGEKPPHSPWLMASLKPANMPIYSTGTPAFESVLV